MDYQNMMVSESMGPTHFFMPRFNLSNRNPFMFKKLHPQVAPRINPWVDAVRPFSSTHVNTNSFSDQYRGLPSALDMFEHITMASKGKQIVMFLDYDGTLSPIVEDPDQAFMSDDMRAAVRDVAKHFPTAIVTGRSIDKVFSFVKLSELYYAGSHGLDIKGPTKRHKGNESVLYQPGSNFLPMIEQVYKALVEKTRSIPGAFVENNKFCVSVHFRRVDGKRWPELAEVVKGVLTQYPNLVQTQGKMVSEIRPSIKWDKGKAVEFLLDSLGLGDSENVFPIYIGDDRTDEDAFKVLHNRKRGFGILVSKLAKETNASYTLREPSEVKCFLQRLVEWKRMSRRRGYCFRS